MSEEEYQVDGPDFGRKAKDRVDAIKRLAGSSSVLFRLGDPPRKEKDILEGQGSRGKGPKRYNPYHRNLGRSKVEQAWSTVQAGSQEITNQQVKRQQLEFSQQKAPLPHLSLSTIPPLGPMTTRAHSLPPLGSILQNQFPHQPLPNQ